MCECVTFLYNSTFESKSNWHFYKLHQHKVTHELYGTWRNKEHDVTLTLPSLLLYTIYKLVLCSTFLTCPYCFTWIKKYLRISKVYEVSEYGKQVNSNKTSKKQSLTTYKKNTHFFPSMGLLNPWPDATRKSFHTVTTFLVRITLWLQQHVVPIFNHKNKKKTFQLVYCCLKWKNNKMICKKMTANTTQDEFTEKNLKEYKSTVQMELQMFCR